MHQRSDLIYAYDGSFFGMLSCIFESFLSKERPFDIIESDLLEPTLLSVKWIATDDQKASRVLRGISRKLLPEANYLVKNAFSCCCERKELMILDFLIFAFAHGKTAAAALASPEVNAIQKAVLYLKREAHFYVEFIRFSQYGQGLVSVIEPKNIVLPTIAPHFCDRLPNELFLIYDKTHRSALIHKPRKWVIVDDITNFVEPQADEGEKFYRELWGTYFDAIAIRERTNPKCQMTHLPLRYREHMTEFIRKGRQQELAATARIAGDFLAQPSIAASVKNQKQVP